MNPYIDLGLWAVVLMSVIAIGPFVRELLLLWAEWEQNQLDDVE